MVVPEAVSTNISPSLKLAGDNSRRDGATDMFVGELVRSGRLRSNIGRPGLVFGTSDIKL